MCRIPDISDVLVPDAAVTDSQFEHQPAIRIAGARTQNPAKAGRWSAGESLSRDQSKPAVLFAGLKPGSPIRHGLTIEAGSAQRMRRVFRTRQQLGRAPCV